MLPNTIGVYTKVNQALCDYIATDVAPHFKTAIVSNISRDNLVELMGQSNRNLFDTAVLSFQVGVDKPHPAIYQAAAEQLAVQPSECLFIDDIQAFCDAAVALGMQSIRYESQEITLPHLKTIIDNVT